MAPYALSAALLATAISLARAQETFIYNPALYDMHFAFNEIPFQVLPQAEGRGPQFGYNICNSTTEGPTSNCQTLIVNSLDDFCLWGAPDPNSTIGDTEAKEVAYCTKKGHGSRPIVPGTLTGVTMYKAKDYILFAGFLDQTKVNLQANDSGGELDPHGADLGGNPLGSLVYSNFYPAGNTNNASLTQVPDWNLFIGGGSFCLKLCDPNSPQRAEFCRNTLDRLGCTINSPNNAPNNVFQVCDSDNMELPGVYTSNGQVVTYTQPPEDQPIGTLPFNPTIPATSNCQTFTSASIFTDFASLAPSGTPTSGSSASKPTGSSSGNKSGSGSSSGSSPSRSGSAGSAEQTGTSGAASMGVSLVVALAGVAFSMAFLA